MSDRSLRRFLLGYLLLLIPLGWLAMRYDRYAIDGDAMSYMDIADLLHAHRWSGAVNAYWHPLYPALLWMAQVVFHPSRGTELKAYYALNYGILALQVAAMLLFVRALVRLRERVSPSDGALLSSAALQVLGIGLLVIAVMRELSLWQGKNRQSLTGAHPLRFRHVDGDVGRDKHRLPTSICGGHGAQLRPRIPHKVFRISAGHALHFGAGCVRGVCTEAQVAPGDRAGSGHVRGFRRRGRPLRCRTFHAETSLRFRGFRHPELRLVRLRDREDALGAVDEGQLRLGRRAPAASRAASAGPARRLQLQGAALRYLPALVRPYLLQRTHQPKFNLRKLAARDRRNAVLIARYLFNHPEPLILLALLFSVGATLRAGERFAWPVAVLGLAMWAIYAMVNVEERYVTVAYFALLLPVFAALRVRDDSLETLTQVRRIAIGMVVVTSLLALGELLRQDLANRRDEAVSGPVPAWRSPSIFGAAEGLARMGVKPGDEIACVGTLACLYDPYWARIAGVRILTEIYDPVPEHLIDHLQSMPNRERAYSVVRQEGARVLVGVFDPGEMNASHPASAGWVRLGQTSYYALPMEAR